MLTSDPKFIIAIILLIAFFVLLHLLFPARHIGGGKIEVRNKPDAWLILIIVVVIGSLLAYFFFK